MEMKKNENSMEKGDNKSLIMYTSLIFIAAVIMIILSSFGQRHLEEMRVSEKAAENVSLSNKAAQVSEENMQLVELNKTLMHEKQALTEERDTLLVEKETVSKEISGYSALITVYDKLCGGNKSEARELLAGIYTEDLSQEQKEIYDTLAKKVQ